MEGEKSLYVPEGEDAGRVEDPKIVREMADVEKPYRETKRFGILRPAEKRIKEGEAAAETRGDQLQRMKEYDERLDAQAEELGQCTIDFREGFDFYGESNYFRLVNSIHGSLGGHEISYNVADWESDTPASVDGHKISQEQLKTIFSHYNGAMGKLAFEKLSSIKGQVKQEEDQKYQIEHAAYLQRQAELAEVEKEAQPLVDDIVK